MDFSWVGFVVEDYIIDSLIGEGSFSMVYRGLHTSDGSALAFKVSRPDGYGPVEWQTGKFNTLAKVYASSGLADVTPPADLVLKLQADVLAGVQDPGIIRPVGQGETAGLFYYKMPFVEGTSLRQKITDKCAPPEALVEVARTMDRLTKSGCLEYHGDLKPDNILLTESGAQLIDPGYFGPMRINNVLLEFCAITTPSYYPFLRADDIFALGVMLWEIVLGEQPFKRQGFSGRSNQERIGAQLLEMVVDLEKVGRYELSAILDLKFPSEINPAIGAESEALLLKAMKLKKVDGGKLELDEGFQSFAEFAQAVSCRFCAPGQPGLFAGNEASAYDAELEEMGVTERLGLFSAREIAGERFAIILKWQEAGHAYVLLACPGAQNPQEYSLTWLFSHGGNAYVVLCFPPPVRGEEAVPTKIVMRVLDDKTLVGISRRQLLEVAGQCLSVIESCRKSAFATIAEVLGAFALWTEVKDEVARLQSEPAR